MSLQPLEAPPPPYSNHLIESSLPSVPITEPRCYSSLPARIAALSSSPSMAQSSNILDNTLPPLQGRSTPDHVSLRPIQLPSVPVTTLSQRYSGDQFDTAMVVDSPPPRPRDSTLSAEDLIVAAALTDLRQSLDTRSSIDSSNMLSEASTPRIQPQEPEPLLSLLKSSHPWLGGTIDGSLSAYASTKSHSPRFLQYGVDFVERNVGSPMANTVGTVGKRTGVEDRLRNYLGSRRSSYHGHSNSEIVTSGEIGFNYTSTEAGIHEPLSRIQSRSDRLSIDSLPAYDESRSPPYEKDLERGERSSGSRPRPVSHSWPAQLMITTSGLGAALSEGSLKSLKFCLGMLRSANKHVRDLMLALKQLLDQYEVSKRHSTDVESVQSDSNMMDVDSEPSGDVTRLAERIRSLNEEIWRTVKTVVTAVSRYTGGALPEHARSMVRWQLLSVPQRWRRAVSESVPVTESQPAGDTVSSAHRMLAFANEGLDMISHVGGVVDSTIISAERWLDTIGRRRPESHEQETARSNDYKEIYHVPA